MAKKAFLLFLAYFTLAPLIKISAQDSVSTEKNSFYPLPVIYYSPETRLAYGATGLYAFRFNGESPKSRGSQFRFVTAYTQENQLLFYLPFQVYKNDEKYNFYGELGYYRYSYKFYGIGNDNPKDFEELYNVNFPRMRLNLTRKIANKFYVGLRYWFDDYVIKKREKGGELDNGLVHGSEGGVISSLGLVSLLDSRDNYNYPTKGNYLEMVVLPNLKAFGSNYEFTRLSVDYVKYLSKNKNILALNLFTVSNLGEPPFNEMAFIGGLWKMRGYYEGTFRDRNLIMAQAEYRRHLFWRLGMAAFAGTGIVARNISEYAIDNAKITAGLGLRFQLDPEEKINIRMDIGVGGHGKVGAYLTIGEAF